MHDTLPLILKLSVPAASPALDHVDLSTDDEDVACVAPLAASRTTRKTGVGNETTDDD